MLKSKKFIVIGIVVAVLVVGTIGGVAAFAQTGTTPDPAKTLLGRVATILNIDQKKLEDAFTQAQKDIQSENLDAYLKDQVAKGKITQAQADQYKSWAQSKPNIPGIGPRGMMGGFRGGFPGMHRFVKPIVPPTTAPAPSPTP